MDFFGKIDGMENGGSLHGAAESGKDAPAPLITGSAFKAVEIGSTLFFKNK